MINAAAKFPKVFEELTYAALGDYDGCLAVRKPDSKELSGRYCILSLAPDFERIKKTIRLTDKEIDRLYPAEFHELAGQDLKIGICVPSSCSSQDIYRLLDEGAYLNIGVSFVLMLQTFNFSAIQSLYWRQTRQCNCQDQNDVWKKVRGASIAQKISL